MFEFTKEQREAWRLIVTLMEQNTNLCHLNWTQCAECMLRAASRFDAREKTCGIEPLSKEHFVLGCCAIDAALEEWSGIIGHKPMPNSVIDKLEKKGLVKTSTHAEGYQTIATDRGREVLSTLNAMCKVEK